MRSLLALGLVLAAACSSEGAPAEDLDTATLVVTTGEGRVELAVEVADTDEERATGLMWREALAPYDGMVFSWPEPTEATFTMENTLIPLSIAFWDERGRIFEIFDMEPCETEDCPSYPVRRPSMGAVEVAQGTFEEIGVEVGDVVELTGAQT